eukprot:3709483-Pleurochrysis_carterae.AAC.3
MHIWTRSGLARINRYAHTHPWHDECGWRAVRETEKERGSHSPEQRERSVLAGRQDSRRKAAY